MKMLIQSLMTLSICFVLSLAANAKTPTAAKVASPSKAEASNDATAIRAVLDAQVAAWNAGKLEEFMTGYWRSPKLTFFFRRTQTGKLGRHVGTLPQKLPVRRQGNGQAPISGLGHSDLRNRRSRSRPI